ncbi:MAG TPA: hypothetical protein VJT82_12800 [Pyrinomonadaceae bacterium]|nr:hypothetical protein [Pyrinomonadaceae bacterium]
MKLFKSNFLQILLGLLLTAFFFNQTFAQTPQPSQPQSPLTSQELVRLVYQLPAHPERRDDVVAEIRRRGIGFELTSGLRGIVATKSGNDALLRRTLEEAERRRVNPTTAVRPSEREAADVLERARKATRDAAGAMPDFVVRQLVKRSYARGETRNWTQTDQLTVAVSYRESAGGEQYKLLAVNGLPATEERGERGSYEQAGGTSSTGEFVSTLSELFADSTQAEFQAADTDTIRERRAIIYDYAVKLENSKQTLKVTEERGSDPLVARVGYRGRVWIDRENPRVLRIEVISTDIPRDFPITAAANTIDYDWVDISGRKYLLPVRSEVELTTKYKGQAYQTRNEIRFRNYQKFGSEVKIIEEGDFEDEQPKKPF